MVRRITAIAAVSVMLVQIFCTFVTVTAIGGSSVQYSIREAEAEANELLAGVRPYEEECKSRYKGSAEYMNAVYDKIASSESVREIAWDDGDTFIFTTTKGMRCAYDYEASRLDFSDDEIISKAECIEYGVRGSYEQTKDAVMFGPFYGIQEEFNYYYSLYQQVCQITADYLGGTYRTFLGHTATPAIMREYSSLSSNAVVVFSTHGECINNCSYVNAYGTDGLTMDDINAGDAMMNANRPGYYLINGNYITNNRTADISVNSIWWFACCEGMMSQGLCAPLIECGAGCVFGYSRSVTFQYEIDFSYAFWDKYTDGVTVKEAAAYAKSKQGAYDPYYQEHARPVFVSPQDPYPGHAAQTVKCELSYGGYPNMQPMPTITPSPTPVMHNMYFVSDEEGFTVSNMPVTASASEGDTFLPVNVPTRVRDANPAVSGGTFSGWLASTDNNVYQPGDPFIMYNCDVTFTALWTDVKFTLTYVGAEDVTEVYSSGETVTVSDCTETPDCMVFEGWICDYDGILRKPGETFVMPYADIVFTPEYTALYAVAFEDYDGTELAFQLVKAGEAAQAPADPVRDGYAFIGWDRDFSCVNEDMIVTAQYEQLQPSPRPTAEPTAEPTTEPVVYGDVNGDGRINTADAVIVLKSTVGMVQFDDEQKSAADVNRNGMVNTADATCILKYAAGIITIF